MGKIWDTKGKILQKLSTKRMTLTELSKELNLAPSTVNQHIKELLNVNAIRQVDNPFILKWKYYEVNPDFRSASMVHTPRTVLSNPIFKVVSAIFIIAVLAVVLVTGYLGRGTPSVPTTSSGQVFAQTNLGPGSVPIGTSVLSLSDSPGVSTISAVNITVDSAMIHSQTTGKWYIVFNGTKDFNLVKLRNTSALLSGANLSAGTYDQIVLFISNGTAVVNNQSEPLFVPSEKLQIFGNFNVSKNTTTWMNIDVNLAKSLHITGSGKVILLPVINTMSNRGSELNLSSNGIITVKTPGRTDFEEQSSMDVNGTFHNMMGMMQNQQEQDNIDVNSQGKVIIVSNPHLNGTATISTEHNIIILTNLTNVTSIEKNITTNETIQVVGNAGEHAAIMCNGEDGMFTCNSVGNINDSNLGQIMSHEGDKIFNSIGIGSGWDQNSSATVNTNVDVNATGSGESGWSANVISNVTVKSSGNLTVSDNSPSWFNSTWQTCNHTSECELVPISYCHNGAPQQYSCINQQSYANYSMAYNGFLTNNTQKFCPLYILDVMKSCSCIDHTCTEVIGNGGGD